MHVHQCTRRAQAALHRKSAEKMGILVLATTVVLLSLIAPSASQEANTTFPLTYRTRAAEGGEQACSSDELRQHQQAITRSELSSLLRNSLPALVPSMR